ncbi:acetate/propionate family kinase [Lactobacillus helveticus]|uniref:Acetate kinase n=1 Tax=Lactobacillus helveticus TaxID=1587 RepID=A0A3S8SBQ7_LACHE|nr:acetate kinase [Lactobacillus helveticus]AFR22375.1 acetate kinase [Lactobacillus helveticus R0052]AZK91041.1 Acetate kinase [Lactobacillus helveticus]MCJ2189347.1 acetate kinase [Lactobacillus helveticus]MED7627288.1 acetate kinase [Lactobacillus helveticus]MZR04877.1 acetate/propionate family kinase [Lactobacillus helveticus]
MKKVLAINSGSSSFKYKLFSLPDEKVIASGMADRVGLDNASFEIKLADGTKHVEKTEIADQEAAVNLLIKFLKQFNVVDALHEIVGVGHRVVNGGEYFDDSTIITKENLPKIYELEDYAPLHNPAEGRGIEAFMNVLPEVPQVAVFDTTYHRALDPVHYLYSLPYEYYEKYGVRKYGAHGTSIRYIAPHAAKMLGKDLKDLKLIICHLGSGASITAVKDGKSYDTSMGFSPIAGITMATRCGDIDPSLIQHLMHVEGKSMDEMIHILNHKSGLLGLSGISPDMRDIRESDTERAKLARKIFINRIVRYVGSYIAEMGGVDAIIFTAGIGEHDMGVRKEVMDAFKYMGVEPDYEANEENGEHFITKPDSKVKVMVIPTNEELIIERDVVRLTNIN